MAGKRAKREKSESEMKNEDTERSSDEEDPPKKLKSEVVVVTRSRSKSAGSLEKFNRLVEAERTSICNRLQAEAIYFEQDLLNLLDQGNIQEFARIYAQPGAVILSSWYDYVRGDRETREPSSMNNAKKVAMKYNLTRLHLLWENVTLETALLLAHRKLYERFSAVCKQMRMAPNIGKINKSEEALRWHQMLSTHNWGQTGHMLTKREPDSSGFHHHTMARIKCPTAGQLREVAPVEMELGRQPTKKEKETGHTMQLVQPEIARRLYLVEDTSTQVQTEPPPGIRMSLEAAHELREIMRHLHVEVDGFTNIDLGPGGDIDQVGRVVYGQSERFQPSTSGLQEASPDDYEKLIGRKFSIEHSEYAILDEIVGSSSGEDAEMKVDERVEKALREREATPTRTVRIETDEEERERTKRERRKRGRTIITRSGSYSPPRSPPKVDLRRKSKNKDTELNEEVRKSGGGLKQGKRRHQVTEMPKTPEKEEPEKEGASDDELILDVEPHDVVDTDVEAERVVPLNRLAKRPKSRFASCILAVPKARYILGQRRSPDCVIPLCVLAAQPLLQGDFEDKTRPTFRTESIIAMANHDWSERFAPKKLPLLLYLEDEENLQSFIDDVDHHGIIKEFREYGMVTLTLLRPTLAEKTELIKQFGLKAKEALVALALTSYTLRTIVIVTRWTGTIFRGVQFPDMVTDVLKDSGIIKLAQKIDEVKHTFAGMSSGIVLRQCVDIGNVVLMKYPQLEKSDFDKVKYTTYYAADKMKVDLRFNHPRDTNRQLKPQELAAPSESFNFAVDDWSPRMKLYVVFDAAVVFHMLRHLAIRAHELENMKNTADGIRLMHTMLMQWSGVNLSLLKRERVEERIRPFGSWPSNDTYEEDGELMNHRAWPLKILQDDSPWNEPQQIMHAMNSFLKDRSWVPDENCLSESSRNGLLACYKKPASEVNPYDKLREIEGTGKTFPHCCINCGEEGHKATCDYNADGLECSYNLCLRTGHLITVCPKLHNRCRFCGRLGHFRADHDVYTWITLVEEFNMAFPMGRITRRLADRDLIAEYDVDKHGQGFCRFKHANKNEVRIIRRLQREDGR